MMTRQTALVTGATSGIGRELARLLAQDGFDLVLVARDAQRLECVADQLGAQCGIGVTVMPRDLAQPGAAQELHQALHERHIAVDVLINAAGMQVYGPIQDTEIDEQLRLIGVNLVALAHLTMLLIQDMRARGGGRILNVASTAGFSPAPLNAVYCATKAFVLSFSEGIAQDLEGTGISVTCLCPGATKTEFAPRAGIEDVCVFTRGAMGVEQVARAGYRALKKGKTTVVPGLVNRLLVFAMRFTPRRLATKMGQRIISRRC